MATPKFNEIALQFMQKINDPTTLSGSPAVVQAGKMINSTVKIESFVNRALMQHFNTLWQAVEGKKEKFAELVPELVKPGTLAIIPSDTIKLIASPYLDYYRLTSARIGTKIIEIVEPDFFSYLQTDEQTAVLPGSDQFFVSVFSGGFNFLPDNTINGTLYFTYIAAPINPETGAALTSGGTYDSLFHEHWQDQISSLAANLYFQTIGEA